MESQASLHGAQDLYSEWLLLINTSVFLPQKSAWDNSIVAEEVWMSFFEVGRICAERVSDNFDLSQSPSCWLIITTGTPADER